MPFHRSATAWGWLSAPSAKPPAVHALSDVHDTALSELSAEPAGTRALCTDQLVPSQRSISSAWWPELSCHSPTASHELADTHETPVSSPPAAPGGVATG